jgi:hypothetical protein
MQRNHRQVLPEENGCVREPKWLEPISKIGFWPNIFVGASFKILNIQQYASGFKLGSAAILNQNPIFEMGSKENL